MITDNRKAELSAQCDRLSDQDLYGLIINKFLNAGSRHNAELLEEAEFQRDILGSRLGFPNYSELLTWRA